MHRIINNGGKTRAPSSRRGGIAGKAPLGAAARISGKIAGGGVNALGGGIRQRQAAASLRPSSA
jgi:hypothetical protein